MTAALFAERIPGARKTIDGYAAPCPAHGGRKLNLKIRDGRSGLLLTCWSRGCEVADVAAAVGLHVADLFTTSRRNVDNYAIERRHFEDAPRETLRDFIVRQTTIARAARIEHTPHDTPHVRSRDVNAARSRANLVFRTDLAPIAQYPWEGYSPNDTDPEWPMFFERALKELAYEMAVFRDPSAMPWDAHERRHVLYPLAADRAAAWIRTLSTSAVRLAA